MKWKFLIKAQEFTSYLERKIFANCFITKKKKNLGDTKSDEENFTERLAKFKRKILQVMDQHGKVQNMNYKN